MKIETSALLIAGFLALPNYSIAQRTSRNLNMGETSLVELEVRRWQPNLAYKFTPTDGSGETVDSLLDLSLLHENGHDYHVTVGITGRMKVRFRWLAARYEAVTDGVSDYLISGTLFPAESPMNSALDLEQLRTGLEYYLIRKRYGYLAVFGEWARFEVDSAYESGALKKMLPKFTKNLPLFGAKTRLYLTPAVALTMEASGFRSSSETSVSDYDLSITYNATRRFGVSYGYRYTYNRFGGVDANGVRVHRRNGQYFGIVVRY